MTESIGKTHAREQLARTAWIARARQFGGQQHVLFGRQSWDQLVRLEYEADLAATHQCQLIFSHSGNVDAVKDHSTRGDGIESRKQPEQRTLATSRRSHNRHEFSTWNLEIDSLENFYGVGSCINCFREVLNFYNGPLDGIALVILYYGFVSLQTLLSCVYLGLALACQAADAPVQPLIVAFGDSLSAGYGADPGKSYPDFLQKLLDESKKNFKVYNAGVSGDTSTDGMQRLPGVLAMKPRIVILELGGNDGLRGLPPTSTKANMEQMIQSLQAQGAKVVLAGMTLPRNYGPAYIHQFEQIYTQLADRYHLTLIPFLLQGVAGHPNLMQADSIHPTNAGNKLVAANVYKYLKPLL